MKLYNPKTKKNEEFFDYLIPSWTVGCTNDNLVDGYKGGAVYITVSAETEDEAKDMALNNEEFMSHIHHGVVLEKKDLVTFEPSGVYVIGEVKYYEGDERL